MTLAFFAVPALTGVLVIASILTLAVDWRLRFALLIVQYGLAAVIVAQAVSWQVALVKGVVGALVVLILVLTGREVGFARRPVSAEAEPEDAAPRSRLFTLRRIEVQTNLPFRVIAVLLAVVAIWYLVTETGYAVPGVPLGVNLAGDLLIGLGLLGLGLSEEPMDAGIGLLMVLNGFELLYSPVEQSLAMAALLAAVNFGVALAISHLTLLRYAGKDAAG